MRTMSGVAREDYEQVYRATRSAFLPTPLFEGPPLASGVRVFFKLENMQRGGSFKVRGVANRFRHYDRSAPRHFAAVSGGNFGIALSIVAAERGHGLEVLVPASAPGASVERMRRNGATVAVVSSVNEAFEQIEALAARGCTVLDDCADESISLGYSTLALEMYQAQPNLTDVIVAVGGGSLLASVSSFYRNLEPSVRVWGVEPVGANAMKRSLACGTPTEVAVTSKISTLGVPTVAPVFLELVRAHGRSILEVSDEDAYAAAAEFTTRFNCRAEAAAGCALAGLQQIAASLPPESAVGVLICGGNSGVRQDSVLARLRE